MRMLRMRGGIAAGGAGEAVGGGSAAARSAVTEKQREQLMAQLDVNNRTDVHGGGVSIAGGIAEFQKDTDQRLAAVFKRADTAMYENKRRLKGTSGSSIR